MTRKWRQRASRIFVGFGLVFVACLLLYVAFGVLLALCVVAPVVLLLSLPVLVAKKMHWTC